MITEIKTTQADNILEIRWAMSNVCNYKCRYCYPGSNEGNYKYPKNTEGMIKNFSHLFDVYTKVLGKTKFQLKILGGEPTLWPELDVFIRGIKEKHDVYVSIITNGSRTLRWWKENGSCIDNICLSYHKQQASLDHIISVADILYELEKKVTVHVLMDNECWDECVNDIETMKKTSKYPWIIQAKKIVPTPTHIPVYTDEQIKYLNKAVKRLPPVTWFLKRIKFLFDGTIRLFESKYTKDNKTRYAKPWHYIVNNENKFMGYECNMGIESLYINWDGSLGSSCSQKLFGDKYSIFDLDFTESFNPEFKPIICKQQTCYCATETHVSKVLVKGISAAQVQ